MGRRTAPRNFKRRKHKERLNSPPAVPGDLPPEPSSPLVLAKETLLKSAPIAADTLVQGCTGAASREQITAARSVLALNGIREDTERPRTPPDGASAAAGAAYGAAAALFKLFGVKPPSKGTTPSDRNGVSDASGASSRRKKALPEPSDGSEVFLGALNGG